MILRKVQFVFLGQFSRHKPPTQVMSPPEAPAAELRSGEGHEHVRPEDRGGLTGLLRGSGLHIPAAGDVHTDQGDADPGQGLEDGLELGPDRWFLIAPFLQEDTVPARGNRPFTLAYFSLVL